MSTISISIRFYPCTIISLIITIHFLFLYRRPATDYDDDDDDSLRRDWHREGGSGNNTGRIRGLLWGERGRSYIIIYFDFTHVLSSHTLLFTFSSSIVIQ